MDSDVDQPGYAAFETIDFSILASQFRWLPFFSDDLYLGMQAMNVGIADPSITQMEYGLLQEYVELGKTPVESAMHVSAFSQMWVFSVYEVLRLWRSRRGEFHKLHTNGGVDLKLSNMEDSDVLNSTLETRKQQLARYRDESTYREQVEAAWVLIDPVYTMVELVRMNLAKHSAPKKDNMIPRSPGYGRINGACGALDLELLTREGDYVIMNRREIADALRTCVSGMPTSG